MEPLFTISVFNFSGFYIIHVFLLEMEENRDPPSSSAFSSFLLTSKFIMIFNSSFGYSVALEEFISGYIQW